MQDLCLALHQLAGNPGGHDSPGARLAGGSREADVGEQPGSQRELHPGGLGAYQVNQLGLGGDVLPDFHSLGLYQGREGSSDVGPLQVQEGCVMGAPGANAAREVLSDLGHKIDMGLSA